MFVVLVSVFYGGREQDISNRCSCYMLPCVRYGLDSCGVQVGFFFLGSKPKARVAFFKWEEVFHSIAAVAEKFTLSSHRALRALLKCLGYQ